MSAMAASPILMPKLGLTMTEGVLAAWHVAAGDLVKTGDVLFVVETDKIATDVEARADGRIEEIKVAEGDTVDVGTVVATWTGPAVGTEPDGTDLGDVGMPAPASELAASPTLPTELRDAPSKDSDRIVATPLARRIAKANDVPLDMLVGTGPRGRIKSDDVRLHLSRNSRPSAGQTENPVPVALAATAASRPASNFEKTVARRLSEAKQQIPHFYVMAEADLTDLTRFRAQLNAGGSVAKISFNHLILLAVGRALRDHPEIATVWQDGNIATLDGSDVGFAVDTPRGLFAPVLRSVGAMRIDDLVAAADAAARRARDGALGRDELSGGAVTVSNVGMFGASWLIPIINPGQSAIIGIGATKAQFRPDASGAPELRHILSMTLSGDHRVLDGVKGARFLGTVARLLEQPIDLVR